MAQEGIDLAEHLHTCIFMVAELMGRVCPDFPYAVASEEGNKERRKSAPRKFRKRRFPQRNDYDRKGGGRSEAVSERWLLGRSHCQVFPSALGIHNSSSAVCVKSAETKPARPATTLANMTANVRASTPKVAETNSIFGGA